MTVTPCDPREQLGGLRNMVYCELTSITNLAFLRSIE